MKDIIDNTVIVSVIFLQFVVLPFFGDGTYAPKLYPFSILTISIGIVFFFSKGKIKISLVHVFFIILVCVLFLSSIQSSYSFSSILYLSILSIYIIFSIIIVNVIDDYPCFFEKVINSLMLAGLFSAFLGGYEYIHFFLIGKTASPLIPWLLPPDKTFRIAGIYGQPNLFAVFLTVVLLAYIYRYLSSVTQRRGSFSWVRFVPVFLITFIFFQTGSRAGLLSFSLLIGLICWLVTTQRYLKNNLLAKREFFFLLICFVCAFFACRGIDSFWLGGGVERSFSDAGLSFDSRYVFWTSAILIFLDNPWLGIGLGNYGYMQDAYGPIAKELLGFVPYEAMGNTDWAHNEILQLFAEGGVLVGGIALFLIVLLFFQIWKKIVRGADPLNSKFLFSHLFLLPFIIQSMFSWPFRSPALLMIFFVLLGLLLAQYSMKTFNILRPVRIGFCALLFTCLIGVVVLFRQEVNIAQFRQQLIHASSPVATLADMEKLVRHPYSEYRVLSRALPYYTRQALAQEGGSLASAILPMSERLVNIEGSLPQLYALARLYHKVGRDSEAENTILKAIALMPLNQVTWSFYHYLNMLKASRDTGVPLKELWPLGQELDFSQLELLHE